MRTVKLSVTVAAARAVHVSERVISMSRQIARFRQFSAGLGLIPLALISACSTTPTARPVAEKIVTVSVPVPVACVDASKVPSEPGRVASELTGDARRDLDIVSASALDLRTWGQSLMALIGPCTRP